MPGNHDKIIYIAAVTENKQLRKITKKQSAVLWKLQEKQLSNIHVDGKLQFVYICNWVTRYLSAFYLMLCEKSGVHHATCIHFHNYEH